MRRDGDGRITYVNDAFCALAGQPRETLLGTRFDALPSLEQGDTTVLADGTRSSRPADRRPPTARAGSPGAKWWCGRQPRAAPRCRASAATSPTACEAERALAEARDSGRGRQPRQVALPRDGVARDPHAAERHPRHGRTCCSTPPLTPEQTTYAKAVKTSGETLLSLIEEILDFSKIEAGRLDLDARPFDLHALVEETVELLAPRAQAKGLEIASYVDERLPARVIGDAARLRQVLLNLAGNAIKFTDSGGVAHRRSSPAAGPDEIVFKVRDTGIGIAPEEQDRIFLEFEQADSGAARQVRRHRPRPRHLASASSSAWAAASASTARPATARPSALSVPLPPAARSRSAGFRAARPRRHARC